MAESLGLAASVLSFVGLAGQILQGCQNVRIFLHDIKDASSDIQTLCNEVIAFESALETFKASLVDIEKSHIDISSAREQISQALECSNKAVESLQILVSKYGRGILGWRNQVGVAMRKEKVDKHSKVLERAKLHLLVAQANVNLIVSYGYSIETRMALSSLPERFQELRSAISANGETALSVREGLSAQLGNLPLILSAMIEKTVGEAIVQHCQKSGSYNADEEGPTTIIRENDPVASQNLDLKTSKKVGRSCWTQRAETWFGTVVMSTTRTHCEYGYGSSTMRTSTKTIRVELTPNRLLLKVGFLLTFHQPCGSLGFVAADLRMRAYGVVSCTAPIIQACESGSLEDVQQLVASGQASPFDRLSGQTTLLDIILSQMWASFALDYNSYDTPLYDAEFAFRKSFIIDHMNNLTLVYRYLIEQGLDPDISSSGFPYVQWIVEAALTSEVPEFFTYMIDVATTIINASTEDLYIYRSNPRKLQWWRNFVLPDSPFYAFARRIASSSGQDSYYAANSISECEWNSWNLRAALIRDPDAEGLRNRLVQLSQLGRGQDVCQILNFLSKIPRYLRQKSFSIGIKSNEIRNSAEKYIKVGIEFGLPLAHRPWDALYLRLYVLDSDSFSEIPQRKEWQSSPVPDWLDEEATGSLAFQLFHLNSRTHLEDQGDQLIRKRLGEHHKDRYKSVRKRLKYYRSWKPSWDLYLEEYDRREWEYRLPEFESPRWSRSSSLIDTPICKVEPAGYGSTGEMLEAVVPRKSVLGFLGQLLELLHYIV